MEIFILCYQDKILAFEFYSGKSYGNLEISTSVDTKILMLMLLNSLLLTSNSHTNCTVQ